MHLPEETALAVLLDEKITVQFSCFFHKIDFYYKTNIMMYIFCRKQKTEANEGKVHAQIFCAKRNPIGDPSSQGCESNELDASEGMALAQIFRAKAWHSPKSFARRRDPTTKAWHH